MMTDRQRFLENFYHETGMDELYLGSHGKTKQRPIEFVTINRVRMQVIINRGFSQRVFRNVSKHSIARIHRALNKLGADAGTWVHANLWKSYQAIETGFGPPQSGLE